MCSVHSHLLKFLTQNVMCGFRVGEWWDGCVGGQFVTHMWEIQKKHTHTQFLTHVWAPKLAIVVQDPLDKKICQVYIYIGGHEQIDVRFIIIIIYEIYVCVLCVCLCVYLKNTYPYSCLYICIYIYYI